MSEDPGQAHVVVYLDDVGATQVERLVERICDLLAEEGLGVPEGDDEAPVRALVGVKPLPFPLGGDEDAEAAFFAEHVQLAIPAARA